MEFKIKCEPIEKLVCKDDLRFTPKEYSLDVQLIYPPPTRKENLADLINNSFGIRIPDFLVICDCLVMTFGGEDQRLKSFDDYTNMSQWIFCNIELPPITSLGMCFVHSITNGDDRASMDSTPTYFFDEPKKILNISLLEVENQKFYKISSNVILGIANDLPSTIMIHPFERGKDKFSFPFTVKNLI